MLREISEELFNQDIMVDVSFEMILSEILIYSTSISVSISFRNPSSSSFDFLINFSEIYFFILSFFIHSFKTFFLSTLNCLIFLQVVSQLLDLCYRNLGGDANNGTPSAGFRSVLDNVTPALIPLQALAAGDKRIAKEIAISVSRNLGMGRKG